MQFRDPVMEKLWQRLQRNPGDKATEAALDQLMAKKINISKRKKINPNKTRKPYGIVRLQK